MTDGPPIPGDPDPATQAAAPCAQPVASAAPPYAPPAQPPGQPAPPYSLPAQPYSQPAPPYGQPAPFYEQPAFVQPVPGVPQGQFLMEPAPVVETLLPPPGSSRPTVRIGRRPYLSLTTNTPFVASAVMFVFGALAITGGVFAARGASPIAGGITTNGTVVSVDPSTSCGGAQHGCTTTYLATVSFLTRSGMKQVASGFSNTEVYVGQSIPVSYDPADTNDNRILFPRSWGFVGLFLVGALLLFICFATLVATARQRWARHRNAASG